MPTPEYHARVSPSAAGRWLHCPQTVALGETMPETSTPWTEAGRLAHSIAELKARKKFFPMSTRTYNSQLKKLQADPSYDKAMEGYTDLYVETLTEHAMQFKDCPFTALEAEVPIGVVTGEKKGDGSPAGGTADCIQIGDGVLWINDYKNGSGTPVQAEDNPQMKLYALGALDLYRPFFGDTIKTIRMTIVQPALGGVSDWETTREELEAWGRDVAGPAAAKALAGEGDCVPGEWCKSHFCPVRSTCRARANDVLSLEEAFGYATPANSPKAKEVSGPLMDDAEVGEALAQGGDLMAWYSDLKEYAMSALLDGKEIPGWKLVEGRGSREWADLDAAFEALPTRGVDAALLWERKPVTPPALEKAIGKKQFTQAAGDLVLKRPGKPALAPESDNRPPYNPAAVAFGEAAG